MSELVRFSVSLEADLLADFDRYCERHRLATRSEAVRQLIRERLTAAHPGLRLTYHSHASRLRSSPLRTKRSHIALSLERTASS